MVLAVSFVFSPETGLYCLRRLRGVKSPPGHFIAFRKLDISVGISGPHDFAVRDRHVRLTRRRVHRILHPTSVTIAKRPSCGHGMKPLYCCF
jgi:hypothetical protein